jgi:putative DNA primase/helicase
MPLDATVRPLRDSAGSTPAGDAPSTGSGARDARRGKPKDSVDWGRFTLLVENFALIYGTDTVWDAGTRTIMKIAAMAHAHGTEYVRLWKQSDQRRTVLQQDVVFDPTMQCDAQRCVNLFGGLTMQPREGDVQPMLRLVRYLTSRAGETDDQSDEIMHWLLCWLAYPLQHQGAKLRTSVVMHGDEGSGKNFLFELMLDLYGEYGALVGQDELEDKFNDWRSRKMFVVGDEVSSRQELVHNKNRLKALITSPKVQINPKGLPRREEANHINVCFLSNELQPLVLDNTDRRYLVLYTPPAWPIEEYRKLGAWKANGGREAWLHYLLNYQLGDFSPYAPAPATRAKEDLIDLARSTAERFWLSWHSGELDLPYWSCAVSQAYRAYLAYCRRVGERFPDKQAFFTRRLLRISEQRAKPVRDKPMRLHYEDDTSRPGACYQKTTRMLLVAEPPQEGQGAWATEAQRTFEQALRDYCGAAPSPEA